MNPIRYGWIATAEEWGRNVPKYGMNVTRKGSGGGGGGCQNNLSRKKITICFHISKLIIYN